MAVEVPESCADPSINPLAIITAQSCEKSQDETVRSCLASQPTDKRQMGPRPMLSPSRTKIADRRDKGITQSQVILWAPTDRIDLMYVLWWVLCPSVHNMFSIYQ